jgi:hypothetical protein
VLEDNALVGYVPASALKSLAKLQLLDLASFNPDPSVSNIFYNTQCLDLPACGGSAECSFEGTAAQVCAQAVPTGAPTGGLAAVDLAAFQAFYDKLQGPAGWSTCATSRNDPCGASNGCPCSLGGCDAATLQLSDRITCAAAAPGQQMRITGIKLRDARLRGWIDESVVSKMSALQVLDLASLGGEATANVIFNGNCLQLPQCYSGAMQCVLQGTGASLCPAG